MMREMTIPFSLLLLFCYSGLTILIVCLRQRKKNAYQSSLFRFQKGRRKILKTFGECRESPHYFTNRYTVVYPEIQLEKWDLELNRSGSLGFSSFTIKQALEFAGRWGGFTKRKELYKRREQLLQVFRLKDNQHRAMREVSKGQQKKTLMAMELMVSKGNIFLDEPL